MTNASGHTSSYYRYICMHRYRDNTTPPADMSLYTTDRQMSGEWSSRRNHTVRTANKCIYSNTEGIDIRHVDTKRGHDSFIVLRDAQLSVKVTTNGRNWNHQ